MEFASLDLDKMASKRRTQKADDIDDDDIDIARVKVRKSLNAHQTRRILSEHNLEQELPWHFEKGACYHCISMGDVDSLTYLRAIVKQQKLEYALLSTWCMAMTDIQEVEKWIDAGYIGCMDFYVGEIFTSRYANEFVALREVATKSKGRIALFRNHSKVIAGFGESFDFAIESSANVNTNPRTEQTSITIDTDIARFYKDFYDGIKSFDHTFDDWIPYKLQ